MEEEEEEEMSVVGVLTVERSPDLGTGNYPRPQSVLVRLPSSHGPCDHHNRDSTSNFLAGNVFAGESEYLVIIVRFNFQLNPE